jgi:diguanylate cyclase (GGDEF)-like protein
MAQKMLDELSRTIHIGKQELHISASIGIAIYPANGESAANLLKAADEAMYQAKRGGRSAYSFAEKE